MKVLLTGASSFTGYWFARKLADAGHHVVAPLRSAETGYAGVRATRVRHLAACAEIVWSAPFGEQAFIELAKTPFDLLCHHGARVTDYRSPDFDVAAALAENTRNLPAVLRALRERGLKGVVLTGSVFEADEGAGEPPLRAFSPYGVSKAVTAEVVRYWCSVLDLPLGKFVIPNPFGPFEEPRFCNFLIGTWRKGEVAEVRTPRYVRDNIHVDLLAESYRIFAESVAGGLNFADGLKFAKANPSGYVESQGTFAQRFAAEMGARLELDARVRLLDQVDFSEPMMRVNTSPAAGVAPGWDEAAAWDSLARFYSS